MKKNFEIAICIPRIDDQVQRDIVDAIVHSAAFKDCKFSILTTYSDIYGTDESIVSEAKIFSLLEYMYADIIIVFPERFYETYVLEEILEIAKLRKVPVISIGDILANTVSISFGRMSCFRAIVSHVIEKHNCKKINFIAGRKEEAEHDERLQAFRETLEKYDIPYEPERVGFGEYWDTPTEKVMDDFLSSNLPLPDAIICANDVMAITAVNCLKGRGYKVPDDIIVTGFDGIDMEKYHSPRITTGSIDLEALTTALYDYIKKITCGDILPINHSIDFIPRFAESCGCFEHLNTKPIVTLWREVSFDNSFNDLIIQMISKIDIKDTIEGIFATVSKFLSYVYSVNISVCISKKFVECMLEGKLDKFDDFGSTMYSIIEKVDDKEANVYGERTFPTSFLVANSKAKPQHLTYYPLHYKDSLFGYVAADTEFNHIALHQLRSFSMNMGYVLERIASHKQMQIINERLEKSYIYDNMTGLLNRNGYYTVSADMIDPQLLQNKKIVIISIDLDNLKEINDKFGHHAGDTAIKIVAKALKQYIGEDGIAARFGGDEFVAIKLFDDSSEEFVHEFTEGFSCTIADKVEEAELEYNISASFGIVSLLAKNIPSLEEGIKSADVLMYAQKRAKKNSKFR